MNKIGNQNIGNPNLSEYPVKVKLHFKSEAARRQFLGGLSDGWGENYCDMDWPFKVKRTNRLCTTEPVCTTGRGERIGCTTERFYREGGAS
jgi:hypothetical protein